MYLCRLISIGFNRYCDRIKPLKVLDDNLLLAQEVEFVSMQMKNIAAVIVIDSDRDNGKVVGPLLR